MYRAGCNNCQTKDAKCAPVQSVELRLSAPVVHRVNVSTNGCTAVRRVAYLYVLTAVFADLHDALRMCGAHREKSANTIRLISPLNHKPR